MIWWALAALFAIRSLASWNHPKIFWYRKFLNFLSSAHLRKSSTSDLGRRRAMRTKVIRDVQRSSRSEL
jgi:hypothetical protein